ncbi:hypothetical protein SEA_ADGERS_93 [Gordonia phage Adgers]|uniref:Uncharacterized protein n=4 Tax=Montyvirus TaxID=2733196 RepID=A0A2L1IVJ7_9CAUD|nr:hypothetical protein BJD64_gp041 [Gordonia phage Hotorobo]YP_009797933.1 hypothetical protein HOS74_gp041 [Gordonia phage Flakey]YP_009837059.1 hypothetical protein HWB50_gp041 [Gordonia phage Adgers]YP_009856379.1 hypothetical protein HWD07_gp041 [Gordonia phage John316]WGH19772.1 hypothetical protein [Gordonia phage Lizzo]AMS02384.1 hypothetical protein SEA_HOTOROBO_92 [Gordonia phage Hotorobo]AUV60386.1 hypothetical protein SEA_FLAKEY_91 [Gordonia phage Flakey]AVD99187.1 hypothetical p
MGLSVTAAEVYDPALSGDYVNPPRLEIMVMDMPVEPTFTEVNVGDYTITHYHWLQSIFNDTWDDEDTTECACLFNGSMHTEDREPVFPVTVAGLVSSEGEAVWQDYYVKISRVKGILKKLAAYQGSYPYEILPNPIYAAEKKFSYMLVHPSRKCVECVREVAEQFVEAGEQIMDIDHAEIETGCPLVQVNPKRVVPMCGRHERKRNYEQQRNREQENI